jgi:hypothetical protein
VKRWDFGKVKLGGESTAPQLQPHRLLHHLYVRLTYAIVHELDY